MKDEKPPIRPKNGLSQEDYELWELAASDVKPLKGKELSRKKASFDDDTPKPAKVSASRPPAKPTEGVPKSTRSFGQGLDRRTSERLRRGQMPIDARIDLHGMSQEQARTSLRSFLVRGQVAGHRCILVITGKGSIKGGILKEKTPFWLKEPPLADIVLKFYPAKPQHGGSGALYVLLRRIRSP